MRRLNLGPLVTSHPDLCFWFSFIILNCLLFLPLYLLDGESSTFLPFAIPPEEPAPILASHWLAWRNNADVFRLSAEVTIFTALWVYVAWFRRPKMRRTYRTVFLLAYLLAVAYYLYEAISLSLFQVDPVFYNQFQLAVVGIDFVLDNLNLPGLLYAGASLLAITGLVLIAGLVRALVGGVPVEGLSRWSRVAIAVLAIWVLASMIKYQTVLASPKMAVSSVVFKLQKNLSDSMTAYRRIMAFDPATPEVAYDYSDQGLLNKPDIYLIFIESYGSVLYHRDAFTGGYLDLLAELEGRLTADGWHMATAISEAPTWGGGSWMSYTSTLFGLRIDTHPQYLALIDEYQFTPYPDLGHFLKSQGYHYLRVSSIVRELKDLDWDQYTRFYGADSWIRFDDLNYEGPLYGWGPAPPDQYVLWRAREALTNSEEQPLFLFFITQNSHYPWTPLPGVSDDWQTLNENTALPEQTLPDPIPLELKRRHYLEAIDYQLRFLTDFIIKGGDRNAIYVLIGDHQPQQVSRHSDGFGTPLHIIARDAGLVDAFEAYGFVPGLILQEPSPAMRHEAFYSMFVRALLSEYGQGDKVLPPYLPGGLALQEGSAPD